MMPFSSPQSAFIASMAALLTAMLPLHAAVADPAALGTLPCEKVTAAEIAKQGWTHDGQAFGVPFLTWKHADFNALRARVIVCVPTVDGHRIDKFLGELEVRSAPDRHDVASLPGYPLGARPEVLRELHSHDHEREEREREYRAQINGIPVSPGSTALLQRACTEMLDAKLEKGARFNLRMVCFDKMAQIRTTIAQAAARAQQEASAQVLASALAKVPDLPSNADSVRELEWLRDDNDSHRGISLSDETVFESRIQRRIDAMNNDIAAREAEQRREVMRRDEERVQRAVAAERERAEQEAKDRQAAADRERAQKAQERSAKIAAMDSDTRGILQRHPEFASDNTIRHASDLLTGFYSTEMLLEACNSEHRFARPYADELAELKRREGFMLKLVELGGAGQAGLDMLAKTRETIWKNKDIILLRSQQSPGGLKPSCLYMIEAMSLRQPW